MDIVKISDFLKKDLVDYASYDNLRKIASLIDGQKNASRKVLRTVLDKNIKTEIKVSRLDSAMGDYCEYLHGSAVDVIVNLAQNFPGSNNIPLLNNEGNFGTRIKNDASAPRYIYTFGSKNLFNIFKKEDSPILTKQFFEGVEIEPLFYVPSLPMLLINGSKGVSSGFAQDILNRNPKDLKKYIKEYINKGSSKVVLTPYYEGYEGTIEQGENHKQWKIKGSIKKLRRNTIEITEVPIGYNLNSYLKILNALMDEGVITNYKDYSSKNFRFEVTIGNHDKFLGNGYNEEELMDKLKLVKTVSENFTAIDETNKIVQYETVEEVLQHYIRVKLDYTTKRKEYQLKSMKQELRVMISKAFFIMCVVSGDIQISKKAKTEIEEQITKFDKIVKVDDSYSYLLNMPIHSLTKEKITEIKEKIKVQKDIILELESTEPKDIWLKEIGEV
mgnify:FL=1